MRRAAGDAVAGRLQLGFDWDFNARSLLRLKLAALEGVLTQRVEVLCALAPVPAAAALAWLQLPPRPLAVRRPNPTPALAVPDLELVLSITPRRWCAALLLPQQAAAGSVQCRARPCRACSLECRAGGGCRGIL